MPPEYVLQWLPLELMGVVAAMAAGIWLWKVAGRPAFRWAKRLKDSLDDFFGEPRRDGVPARPGVMARLERYDERIEGMTTALGEHAEVLAKVKYHVMPNSGKSAYDMLGEKIDELAASVGQIAATQRHLAHSQLEVAGAVDRLREDKERAHEEMLRRIGRIEQHRPAGEES